MKTVSVNDILCPVAICPQVSVLYFTQHSSIATGAVRISESNPICPEQDCIAYFLNMPKNIRSLLVSSGGFSAACDTTFEEVEDGAVEAGEASYEAVDDMGMGN